MDLVEYENDGALGTVAKNLETEGTGNQRKKQDHQNYSRLKIR